MKTIIDINEDLLGKAMKVARTTTKKETVQIALQELIKLRLRERLKSMAGSGMLKLSLHDLRLRRKMRTRKHSKIQGS